MLCNGCGTTRADALAGSSKAYQWLYGKGEEMEKTIQTVIIHTDGVIEEKAMEQGCKPLQDAVGGFIEAVYSNTGDTTLWINEEGKLHNMSVNWVATALWWNLDPAARGADILVGPVVVTGGIDEEGYTRSISSEGQGALSCTLEFEFAAQVVQKVIHKVVGE
jgi:hypothetical protein